MPPIVFFIEGFIRSYQYFFTILLTDSGEGANNSKKKKKNMQKILLLLCVSLVVFTETFAASCPDVTKYRSANVLQNFDPSKLSGLWYEQGYLDVAQIGASCPVLNNTIINSTFLTMDLSVKYLVLPFSIKEMFFRTNETGYYIKQADMPGSSLLKIPTVVVDFTEKDGVYESLTLYGCLAPLGIVTEEIVFATRERYPPAGLYPSMVTTARSIGISFGSPTQPDWTKCP